MKFILIKCRQNFIINSNSIVNVQALSGNKCILVRDGKKDWITVVGTVDQIHTELNSEYPQLKQVI